MSNQEHLLTLDFTTNVVHQKGIAIDTDPD
jgi:hypothetical protein